MRFMSLFSGIEAASVAWRPLGWKCAAVAEIEPFPCAVLAHHYPDVPNLGDVSQHEQWPETNPDIIVGGSPCQAFSVAGLRQGLSDPRGNLTLTYLAVVAQYRPKWVVWENVPGVLSIDQGRVFGAFLGALGQLGYGWAYRILDAQYFGVPQRRRRVFVVGYLGDWHRPAAVLFEPHSLSGHPAPSREAGKGVAPTISARTQGGGGLGTDLDLDGGLIARCDTTGEGSRQDYETTTLVPCHMTGNGFWQEGLGTLRARAQDSHENLVAHFLRAEGFDASEDGTGRGTPLVPGAFMASDYQTGEFEECQTARPLTTSSDRSRAAPIAAVAFQSSQSGVRSGDTRATLDSNNGSRRHNGAVIGSHVRHLTPIECERLQGFPDDYTRIPYRNKSAEACPDGPRYKALGNSFAVPVVRWIGERIAMVEAIKPQHLVPALQNPTRCGVNSREQPRASDA
jgi:DNA (cytosine-5)-methyltransferase 1